MTMATSTTLRRDPRYFRDLLEGLDRGVALPTTWYLDPAISALEVEYIFRRSWQYVGRLDQLPVVGSYFTSSVGDIPIILVRAPDGPQGLVNVCRHRRHEVVEGAGHRQTLQCPYHAWTYELDGRLRTAPRSEREVDFCKDDYPLLPVQVATWGPWIFANPDKTAAPFVEVLGELPRIIAECGIDLAGLRVRGRTEWSRDVNWKIMLENFLECYHCPVQHPSFSAIIDVRPDTYALEEHAWFSSQRGSVRERTSVEPQARAYDAEGEVHQAQYHFLWPNLTLSINPGQPNLSLDVWIPSAPGRTQGFSEHYFGPDVSDAWADEMIAFNAQVGDEDDRLTSSVQRGIRCGVPDQGRFLPASEHLCIHFQKLLVTALAASAAPED
jgi:phenylpropionate dioxygenase-like ring-hydroxylating dioxygenase large terminal subunit